MTEELRTLLRAELGEERPPPLGDLVDVAIRDGRRIRRVRRLALAGAGAAVLGLVALTVPLAGSYGGHAVAPPAAAPLPLSPSAPALPPASPFPVPILALRPTAPLTKTTAAGMLALLTQLLPPGKTSHYAVGADGTTYVQLYLDTGRGPGMIRVSVEKDVTDRPRATDQAYVTVDHLPDNCVQSIMVDASLPNGASVSVEVSSCLAWDGKRNTPAPPAITEEQAVRVATDPRWGLAMDSDLVKAGSKMFPDPPTMR